MRISDYVKKNPRASEAQLRSEVEKEIKIFAQKVAQLEGVAWSPVYNTNITDKTEK